jgi:RND family efflux transporter MFP subunit
MVPMKTPVANVVDISTLKANVRVAESDVFALRTGKEVELSTEVYPGVPFRGKVNTISAKSDESHSYAVEITLPNSREHPLKAGMFARVIFPHLRSGRALTIPRSALVGSVRQAQVYVVKEGMASLRSLVIEGISGDVVRVRSGLTAGESVVTNGQNNLRDNIAVTVAN